MTIFRPDLFLVGRQAGGERHVITFNQAKAVQTQWGICGRVPLCHLCYGRFHRAEVLQWAYHEKIRSIPRLFKKLIVFLHHHIDSSSILYRTIHVYAPALLSPWAICRLVKSVFPFSVFHISRDYLEARRVHATAPKVEIYLFSQHKHFPRVGEGHKHFILGMVPNRLQIAVRGAVVKLYVCFTTPPPNAKLARDSVGVYSNDKILFAAIHAGFNYGSTCVFKVVHMIFVQIFFQFRSLKVNEERAEGCTNKKQLHPWLPLHPNFLVPQILHRFRGRYFPLAGLGLVVAI